MATSAPQPPAISEDDWNHCRESGDYRPILFEWYKYVGVLSNFFASIHPKSPALRTLPPVHYAVLIGLLNRCSRLMLANVSLASKQGLFGETTLLIDRCIFESTVKIAWLCHKRTAESFDRLIGDGLKTELAFKERIISNIQERGGQKIEIEDRMLRSVERTLASSGLSEAQIAAGKKLPDLAAMIEDLGHHKTVYVSGQKIGSHHVHGTWPSLLFHYLILNDEGIYMPRGHDCETHINQYIFVPLLVLASMKAFAEFIILDPSESAPLQELTDSIREEILTIHREVAASDLQVVA